MSLVIEVFRSDDYRPDGEIPLLPVLGVAFQEVIGPSTQGATFELYFYELMDLTPDLGKPSLVNLRASHGFVRVRIWRNAELLYQHPHPVRELIGEPLRELLRKRDPDVGHWGYGVRGPGLESIPLQRPTPQVAHELRVTAGTRRRPRFTVEEVREPEPPLASLADLGADVGPARSGPYPVMSPPREPVAEEADATVEAAVRLRASRASGPDAAEDVEAAGQDGAGAGTPPAAQEGHGDEKSPSVIVAAPASLVSALVTTLPYSGEIEEGGFLAGRVYRDREHPGGYLVHVTAVIPAERTGASMINFTFTGESFLRVSEQLAARGEGEALLGWYHTHLFAATARSGLSSVDVELHKSTFRRPWQVAALLNISHAGRVLRFYHGGDADEHMVKVPYWTVPS